jgi:predicted Zn-dependent protease
MTLAAQAQQLLLQGRVSEAERAFEQILHSDPNDVQALNIVALVALRGGDLTRAHELLQRARAARPCDPVTQHHLGQVFDAGGQYAAAAEAQRAAIAAQPEFYVARLYLGRSLEHVGLTDQAVVAYARALRDAQGLGRWLNSATTPPAMQAMVEHAVIFVREGRRAAFARLFDPVAAK